MASPSSRFLPEALFIDIDGTITDWARPVPPESLVGGQPIFGLFRDLMIERGQTPAAAARALEEYAARVIWWDYPDFPADFSLPVAAREVRIR